VIVVIQITIILVCRQTSKYGLLMTSITPLPTSIEDLTPAWLTSALRDGGSIDADTEVTTVRPEQIAEGVGFFSYLYRLHLELNGEGPSTLVAKLPTDTPHLQLAQMTGAYEREVTFYSQVAPASPLRTPRAHIAAIVPGTTDFVLVMDDLRELECADHLAGLSLERAERVIDELARFHAWGWGLRPTAAQHPAFVAIDSPVTVGLYTVGIAAGWEIYCKYGRVQPPAGLADAIDNFGELLPAMVASVAEPGTLINGDLRADNLFFDADQTPTTVDFQLAMRGAGIWDVAYLVGQGLTKQERGDNERRLVERYVDGLGEAGIDYPIEQAWQQFRTAVLAQITFPLTAMMGWDGLNDRAKELLHALTERAFSIIEDTDALSDWLSRGGNYAN
jgi:Ecdysteroid kinase-like family